MLSIPVTEPFHIGIGLVILVGGLIVVAVSECVEWQQEFIPGPISFSDQDIPPTEVPEGGVYGSETGEGGEGGGIKVAINEEDGSPEEEEGGGFEEDLGIDVVGEGGGCFTSDTDVLMDDGTLRPISTVEPDHQVMAWNATDGTLGSRRVARVYRHDVSTILRLKLGSSQTVVTTPAHRFFVEGQGFIPASQLKPGAMLVSPVTGLSTTVVSIDQQRDPCVVFNLSVEGDHTYFVGADRLLVHNLKEQDAGSEDPWDDE